MNTPHPPLPYITDDPAFTGSNAVKARLAEAAEALRLPDGRTTELQRLAALAEVYDRALYRIEALWEDWADRADARITWLEARQPVGPGIPSTAGPADREVLLAAFRGLLTDARNTDTAGRQSMLRDAISFGDDTQRRAVTTAMIEAGERHEVARVVETHDDPQARAELDEWMDLRALRSGGAPRTQEGSLARLFLTQAKSAPTRPAELQHFNRLAALAGVTTESARADLTTRDLARMWARTDGHIWQIPGNTL